jgi:hypothetical protein
VESNPTRGVEASFRKREKKKKQCIELQPINHTAMQREGEKKKVLSGHVVQSQFNTSTWYDMITAETGLNIFLLCGRSANGR